MADPITFTVGFAFVVASGALSATLLQHYKVVEHTVLPFFEQLVERKDIPFLMVFVAITLTYVVSNYFYKFLAAVEHGFNNKNPRAQHEKFSGITARALAAHKNMLEDIAIFAFAVLLAHVRKAPLSLRIRFSIIYVFARIFFLFAYILNVDFIRSLMWVTSFFSTIFLILVATFPQFDVFLQQFGSQVASAIPVGKLF